VTQDDWAEAAAVGVQIHSEPSLHTSGHRTRGGHSVRVRNVRNERGLAFNVASVFDGDGPPKLTFIFENGRIRAIVANAYKRVGNGWVLQRTKTTAFGEDGHPLLQLKSEAAPPAGTLAAVSAAHPDALMLLGNPSASLLGEATCVSEWTVYALASGLVAAATTAFTTETAACLAGGPAALIACPAAAKAATALSAAIIAWNTALDKLEACLEKGTDDASMTGTNTFDGGIGGGGGGWDEPGSDLATVIDQFIDEAYALGNYTCSASGDHCIYYAT